MMKNLLVSLLVLSGLLPLNLSLAQGIESDPDEVWTGEVYSLNRKIGLINVGDLDIYYKRPAVVRGESGERLSLGDIKPGIRVRLKPLYRRSHALTKEIVVLGR